MCSISERTCSRPIALLHLPLDCSNKPLGTAPELVVKTKPPEQDLDFTGVFHETKNRTNRERVGKPLGIGCAGEDHLKVFADEDAADRWFQENDPEGVAFKYEILE